MSDARRIYLLQCQSLLPGFWETISAFTTRDAAEAAKERAERTDAVPRMLYRVSESWLYGTADAWWDAE